MRPSTARRSASTTRAVATLRAPPVSAEALGEVAREQRDDRHAERVEQQRVGQLRAPTRTLAAAWSAGGWTQPKWKPAQSSA